MPRYLTPFRLCLMALIELYIAEHIATTSKLHVLAFISSHINIPASHDSDTVEERVAISSSDITALSQILSQWRIVSGRTVYDHLLRHVWQPTESDAMDGLFARLRMIAHAFPSDGAETALPKISPISPLGIFIRRCWHEYERQQWSEREKLWVAFVAYRAPSYERRISADSVLERQINQTGGPYHGDPELIPALLLESTSSQDIDTVLGLSIYRLQRIGSRVPENVKLKIRNWLQAQGQSSASSLQYFLSFFEHWKAGEMAMALESLHQYFDYSVGANSGSDNLKVYFQYAQLHQSVLYADFGCWDESVNAMSECIATARENQDPACLNFALSWLLHLRQMHPHDQTASFEGLISLLGGSTEHDEIKFLKTKAKESKHWSLMSSTFLEEAKLEMYSDGNTHKAFEFILQSAYLNVQHDQRTIMAATALFESACFERLGQSRLGYRICQSATWGLDAYAPLSDRVRAYCRISHLFSQTGQYGDATNVVREVEPRVRGVLRLAERVQAFHELARMKWLTHRDEGKAVNRLLGRNRSIFFDAGPEVDFEGELLDIQHLIEMERLDTAMEAVNRRIRQVKTSRVSDVAQLLHLMVVKAKIFTHVGKSANGFSLALRVASKAERLQLVPVLIGAIGVLGRVMVELREFEAARDLLAAALPHALCMPDVQLRAELLSTLASACIGIALQFNLQDQPRSGMMINRNLALNYLTRCRDAYALLEDRSGVLSCLSKHLVVARWSEEHATALQLENMHTAILDSGSTTSVFPKARTAGILNT